MSVTYTMVDGFAECDECEGTGKLGELDLCERCEGTGKYPDMPDEWDGYIFDHAWKPYTVELEGKYIGEYSDVDDACEALSQAMLGAEFWPNCWLVDERGWPSQIVIAEKG